MRHEKIFIREDKSKVSLTVSIDISTYSRTPIEWDFSVAICEPRKRTWKYVTNKDDYSWRKLSMEDRAKYDRSMYLKHVTTEEVLEVQMELWEMIKPKLIDNQ
jgi:hypothetical protein